MVVTHLCKHLCKEPASEHTGDGVTFRREYNHSWRADQVSVFLHYPPGPAPDAGSSIQAGAMSVSAGEDVHVEWQEGFSITTRRPDGRGYDNDTVLVKEQIPLSEACRRLERRTELPRLIRQKEQEISKLTAELEELRRKAGVPPTGGAADGFV